MTDHIDISNAADRSDGWRPTAMSAMWAVLILIMGWIVADTTSARTRMSEQINSHSERIAVLEEASRNARESLVRIETGVHEIRQSLQRQERRP